MNDIIKMVVSFEKSSILINVASETVKYEKKKQKGWFFSAYLEPRLIW